MRNSKQILNRLAALFDSLCFKDFEEIEEAKDYTSLGWPRDFIFTGVVESSEDKP